jgi:nucleoid-associated protein YgaU
MKKLICTFMAFAFIATAMHAQSLADNSYYQESVRLTEAATAAYDEGDYDTAKEYALLAQENARLSDEYVAQMLAMQAAEDAIAKAQERYDWATGVRAATRYAERYAVATAELAAARASYKADSFDEAVSHANLVLSSLAGMTEAELFPSTYVVQRLDFKTDCLWRIAGMPFVYNDPFKWPVLYEANRSQLPNPKNPDLILPGMVLKIPSIAGEIREGEWTKGVEYPTFGK